MRIAVVGVGAVGGYFGGLETEVGAVVSLAQTAGVRVPIHTFLYAGLLPQERKPRHQIEFAVAEQEPAKAA